MDLLLLVGHVVLPANFYLPSLWYERHATVSGDTDLTLTIHRC
jgi:hypothetical protein